MAEMTIAFIYLKSMFIHIFCFIYIYHLIIGMFCTYLYIFVCTYFKHKIKNVVMLDFDKDYF